MTDEETKKKEQAEALEQLNGMLDQTRPKNFGQGLTSGVSNIVGGALGAVGVVLVAPVLGGAVGMRGGGIVGGIVGVAGGAVVGAVGAVAIAVGGASLCVCCVCTVCVLCVCALYHVYALYHMCMYSSHSTLISLYYFW
jgi:hypothetical protein